MALLLDDPISCSRAPTAKSPEPVPDGRVNVAALIERWHLEPAEFQVRRHELCESSGFAPGNLFVTVANRRVRASRTYLSCVHSDEWTREFEQDLPRRCLLRGAGA